MMQLQQQIESLSLKFGISSDILKTVFVIFLNIFLSGMFPLLKSPSLRKIFSLFVGFFQLLFLIKFQSIYILITMGLVFLLIKLFKTQSFLITIICSTVSLLIVHLQRYIFDYSSWKVDCSVYFMFLATKLTYYGLSIQKNQQIDQSLLQYSSYCLFFPGLLAGPTFSYQKFLQFMNLKGKYKKISISKKNIIQPFFMGIACSIITAIVMPIFDHQWILRNQQYQKYPVIGKLIAISIIGFFYRIKFYTAWYLTQTAINLSGLSFHQNGKNNQVICGSIMFEIQPNPKNKTQYWNSSIQIWLKVVVYDNIVKKFKNPSLAVFGTFFISAFWHGIYLTYYLGFIQWGILTHLTKWIYKMSFILPKKIRQSIFSTILVYVIGTISLNYLGMTIVLLEWDNMIKFYTQLNYSITIGLIVLLILSFIIKPPRQSKNKIKQDQIQTLKSD